MNNEYEKTEFIDPVLRKKLDKFDEVLSPLTSSNFDSSKFDVKMTKFNKNDSVISVKENGTDNSIEYSLSTDGKFSYCLNYDYDEDVKISIKHSLDDSGEKLSFKYSNDDITYNISRVAARSKALNFDREMGKKDIVDMCWFLDASTSIASKMLYGNDSFKANTK